MLTDAQVGNWIDFEHQFIDQNKVPIPLPVGTTATLVLNGPAGARLTAAAVVDNATSTVTCNYPGLPTRSDRGWSWQFQAVLPANSEPLKSPVFELRALPNLTP